MKVVKQRPVPTTGGGEVAPHIVDRWLLEWAAERRDLDRYEAALREIAKRPDGDPAGYIARKALGTW